MSGDTLRGEITDPDEYMTAHAEDPYLVVVVARFQNDTAAARAAIDPLLADTPDDIRVLALEAEIWRDEGRFDEAADRYRRLIWGVKRPSLQATLPAPRQGALRRRSIRRRGRVLRTRPGAAG